MKNYVQLFWGIFILVFLLLIIERQESQAQNLGRDFKNMFTFKKKHCKIANIYSGVAVGQVLNTQKYGKGVVKNFRVNNKISIFYRYVDSKMQARKKVVKITKAIKNIVLLVPKDPTDSTMEFSENLQMKKVVLSIAETKQIMLQQLVIKKKYNWILRMYPEERANLRHIIAKYSGKPYDNANILDYDSAEDLP